MFQRSGCQGIKSVAELGLQAKGGPPFHSSTQGPVFQNSTQGPAFQNSIQSPPFHPSIPSQEKELMSSEHRT